MSGGCAMPIRSSTVGATSASRPPARSFRPTRSSAMAMNGIGFVVCAVCGWPGLRIDHGLAVAVIGGDEHRRLRGGRRGHDAADARVDRLERADRGLQHAGVADHVGVGVVDQDEVGAAGLERLDDAVGDRHRRHLGREVVGRDVAVRRHQPALLARERLFDAAVEEVGDVRVLLGLGGAQLRDAVLGQHLAQDLRQALGRERGRHVDLRVVAGHGRERGELRPRPRSKCGKSPSPA